MRRIYRTPVILPNGNMFYPWTQLTKREQDINNRLTGIIFQFCREHPNTEVTFEQMNRVGLTHLYRFWVDEYNRKFTDKPLTLTENGLIYEYKIKRKKTGE